MCRFHGYVTSRDSLPRPLCAPRAEQRLEGGRLSSTAGYGRESRDHVRRTFGVDTLESFGVSRFAALTVWHTVDRID